MVATRMLASDITGGCYTFGAPPIGTIEVQNTLKTPVYQIVNEIDIVPRLPNPWASWAIRVLLRLFRLAAKAVTLTERLLASGTWDERLEAYITSMTRFRHPGYVSYLVGSGESARLRYNVSTFDLAGWWVTMITKQSIGQFKRMVTDHSIDVYVEKLRVHAQRRQRPQSPTSSERATTSKSSAADGSAEGSTFRSSLSDGRSDIVSVASTAGRDEV